MTTARTVSMLLIVVLCLSLCGCKTGGTDASPSQGSANPTIGHLQTRAQRVTIHAGPEGPLYTVYSEAGQILAMDIPAEEVSRRFPELKMVMERGIADWAGLEVDRLDASLD